MKRFLKLQVTSGEVVRVPVTYVVASLRYLWMARGWTGLDSSNDALWRAFQFETQGQSLPPGDSLRNAYLVGKRYLNLQVQSWREDIRSGLLLREELYEEPSPWSKKFLDEVLKDA